MFGVLLIAAFAAQPSLKPGSPEWAAALEEIAKRPLPPDAGDILYEHLQKFRGKPARFAFDRLGYPDRQMTVAGATVYSWVNETTNRDGSPLRCTIKVIVRRAKIADTDYFGNNGACARFARAFVPSFRL